MSFHGFTVVPSLGVARMSLGSQAGIIFSNPEIAGANVPARRGGEVYDRSEIYARCEDFVCVSAVAVARRICLSHYCLASGRGVIKSNSIREVTWVTTFLTERLDVYRKVCLTQPVFPSVIGGDSQRYRVHV